MSQTAPLQALAQSLRDAAPAFADTDLVPLADKGLAHHHVRLAGTGVLARLPKQSQLGLAAQANLDYQAACFARASASGHAPQLRGVLPPSAGLPRGGLLVEEIVGRPARLPDDLPALADALAALHRLPLPDVRAPLLDPADPLAALQAEIDAQALHLAAAALDAAARARIDDAFARFASWRTRAALPPSRLIAFDAHPGNFIVQGDGRAVLVDLEKARYGAPPLDVAHATLYTSTTWDVDSYAELTTAQVLDTSERWLRALRHEAWRAHIAPLRRAMWLWSVTWCAKWRALSNAAARDAADGEDWSRDHSDAALVRHVRGRVDTYLSAPVVEAVCAELAAVDAAFGA
jgi:thiamine kinase-like enzyme